MKKTGFIYDESYFWHDTGNGALFMPPSKWVESDIHVESPATKRRIKNLIEKSGIISDLNVISPRSATVEEIELFHTTEHIQRVKELSDGDGGEAGEFAIVGRGSYEIALLAAGGALTAVDSVIKGDIENAYVLTRPPGHHAEKDHGLGFCIFNNVAIAAKYAKKEHNLNRILIIDWDVHHGNGIESAFYNDPNVLYISIYQEGLSEVPDRGYIEDVGEDEGKGFNINIPLPAGTGNAGYMNVFKRIIEPITNQFKPELIMVAAGQDPNLFDPLGRMMVTADGFYNFTEFTKQLANKHCDGKLVICHEGGYSAAYVPFCSLKIVEALSGIETEVEDPFFVPALSSIPTNKLLSYQNDVVNKVIEVHSKYWSID